MPTNTEKSVAGVTEENKKMIEMEYRMMGGTGLKVSILGFGCMTFTNVNQAIELLSSARKNGINLFDNAEMYGKYSGEEESIFGEAYSILKEQDPILWRRSDIVITTKIFWGGNGENETGISMKHCHEAMNSSLKRMKLDYVDVVLCHRHDGLTPVEEYVRAFTKIINDGKAFYWGTSEWPIHKIVEAHWVAKYYGLIPPIVEQPQYNMFTRENVEKTLMDVYKSPYNIGLTTWSPLYGGILSGKYTFKKEDINNETRTNVGGTISKHYQTIMKQCKESNESIIIKLQDYAENKLQSSLLHLSLAWCIKNQNVSCCLLGASKSSQLDQSVGGCLELARRLTIDNMKDIDNILNNKPSPAKERRTIKKTI